MGKGRVSPFRLLDRDWLRTHNPNCTPLSACQRRPSVTGEHPSPSAPSFNQPQRCGASAGMPAPTSLYVPFTGVYFNWIWDYGHSATLNPPNHNTRARTITPHTHTKKKKKKRQKTIRRSLPHFSAQRGSPFFLPQITRWGSRSGRGAEFLPQHNSALRETRSTHCRQQSGPPRLSPCTHAECPRAAPGTGTLPALPRTARSHRAPRARRAESPRGGTKRAKREQGNIPLLPNPSSCSHSPPGSAGSNCS